MLEHESGADMRLVRQIGAGMKIQAGPEHMGCGSKDHQESQVVCVQCQDELVRVCPGSPHSPRRAIATRLSSGSADREPSSSSYNVSSGTFYSCVSQITIGIVANASHLVQAKVHPTKSTARVNPLHPGRKLQSQGSQGSQGVFPGKQQPQSQPTQASQAPRPGHPGRQGCNTRCSAGSSLR